jgi:hypothetical protein
LETASNAEQVRWIKEELRQYGLLDKFMDPTRTEQQLKNDSYKYIGWGIEGARWKYSAQIFAAIQSGEQGTYAPPSAPAERTTSGYAPSKPGLFDVIEYITGDRSHSNYRADHGGTNYHEHMAFRTSAKKETAKRALINAGFVTGSEYRPGDRGYHGIGLALDVPFYGQRRRYSDNRVGEEKFSADIRAVLGLRSGGVVGKGDEGILESDKKPRNTKPLEYDPDYSQNYIVYFQPIMQKVMVPVPVSSGSVTSTIFSGDLNSSMSSSMFVS